MLWLNPASPLVLLRTRTCFCHKRSEAQRCNDAYGEIVYKQVLFSHEMTLATINPPMQTCWDVVCRHLASNIQFCECEWSSSSLLKLWRLIHLNIAKGFHFQLHLTNQCMGTCYFLVCFCTSYKCSARNTRQALLLVWTGTGQLFFNCTQREDVVCMDIFRSY